MPFMHTWLLLFTSWALAVSGYDSIYDDPRDLIWAIEPDLTHDELLANGFAIPETASPVTAIEHGVSYIAKLECLKCPFDIRSPFTWDQYEQPGRPNSLLLNFTLAPNRQSLLLNGQQVYPSGRQTSRIRAYQIQTNASKQLIGKIGEFRMLDDSWQLATRFGIYGLSFDETIQSARGSRRTHLSFDIIGISYFRNASRRNFLLDALDQQIIRLVLEREHFRHYLQIKDIQLLDRCEARPKDKSQTCRDPKSSLHSYDSHNYVSFRDWDWDHYGRKGTLMHSWNSVWWNVDRHPFLYMGSVICIVITVRKLSTQIYRRGFRYLRRSSSKSEETETVETTHKNLYLDRERM